MDKPTTSYSMRQDIEVLKPDNLGSLTTTTLKRMIWKLKLDQKSNTMGIPLSDPISRTARYTGMHKTIVEKLLASEDNQIYETVEIDRRVIHNSLIASYLLKQHVPTIKQFFNILSDKLPAYVDLDYFTKMLIKMGYVFYKFPRRQSLRVMEKKSVTFERYRYLKSIQQYRRDKVPIVYIGLISISIEMNLWNLERTLQTDVDNILHHMFFTVTSEEHNNVKVFPPSKYEVLQDFIKKSITELLVLKNLPPGCVCVLEDSKIFRETSLEVPTWKSVKSDMVEWLEAHNIPCHLDMSKAELLDLIEICTDPNEHMFEIDQIVKLHNYSLLRIPQCINGLSMVPMITRALNSKEWSKDYFWNKDYSRIFELVPSGYLKEFSNIIQREENEQLKQDIVLDNKLDDLIKKMKTLDEGDDEDDMLLPYSDSE